VVRAKGFIVSNENQQERVTTPKRRGRRLLVWLGGILAVLLGLTLLGALYETAAEAADVRAYPPPGQMVDVGGYRLHINCVGTGSPTVVIEAGWGDWSATWSSWVQPAVAQTTRVCTYDRAGYGYSEAGPLPRTADRFAQELHTLLQEARVPGPYVVVGHSLGGALVRVFAHDYPAEVAGVVLIESMNPSAVEPSAAVAPPPTDLPSSDDWILTFPARVGLLRLLAGPLGLSAGLSPEVANTYVAFSVTPRHVQTTIDEGRGMPAGLAQARAIQTLGAVPVIVLSRGLEQDQTHQAEQSELLHLSPDSQQLVADRSGHNVQIDQPEAAVGAIATMVEQARRKTVPDADAR
jgi:pimeloyl-ACP methyl ester carboxylesterase